MTSSVIEWSHRYLRDVRPIGLADCGEEGQIIVIRRRFAVGEGTDHLQLQLRIIAVAEIDFWNWNITNATQKKLKIRPLTFIRGRKKWG